MAGGTSTDGLTVGTADGFDPAEVSLTSASVEEWRGLVFVNFDLDRTGPPLLEALGTFADECEPSPTRSKSWC